jgi:quinol monooxygenase YgiN
MFFKPDHLYTVARFHAKANAEQPLSDALLTLVEPTRAEPGCLRIHLCRAIRDAATLFIQSAWVDEEAFEKHATFAAHNGVSRTGAPMDRS